MTESPLVPGFAPSDPTDGRDMLDWKSRYAEPRARRGILFEAYYLGSLLMLLPIFISILWLEYPKHWFVIPNSKYPVILKFGMAWLNGMLGGTLFALKWLYHSVARRMWHLDRRLWRVFTPHISGGLAFAVIALVSSGIIRVFDSQALESNSLVAGLAFLVGYFSDSAIAKLTEIAETLFGTTRSPEKQPDRVASEESTLQSLGLQQRHLPSDKLGDAQATHPKSHEDTDPPATLGSNVRNKPKEVISSDPPKAGGPIERRDRENIPLR